MRERMSIRLAKSLLRVLTLLVLGGTGARAQSAAAVQDLNFGTLLPGVSQNVAVTSALSRGHFTLDNVGGATLEILFLLPTGLASAEGATLPLSFQNGDAALVLKGGKTTLFDPRSPFTAKVPAGQSPAQVYLGGTASPGTNQAAGVYSATVTLVVSNTGV
jgi:spore coat protein U-like protein